MQDKAIQIYRYSSLIECFFEKSHAVIMCNGNCCDDVDNSRGNHRLSASPSASGLMNSDYHENGLQTLKFGQYFFNDLTEVDDLNINCRTSG